MSSQIAWIAGMNTSASKPRGEQSADRCQRRGF
jgi:hypothetical protein